MPCSNCSAVEAGAPRTLVVESERALEVTLCEPCHDAFLEEPWIEPTG